MWHIGVEQKIIEFGKEKNEKELSKIREDLFIKHKFIVYAIDRFMLEFGDELETNNHAKNLYAHLFDQFSNIERLFRIMRVYE